MSLQKAIIQAQAKATELPDSVISVYDDNGIICFITPNVLEYTGYTAEQSIGLHYGTFTPDRDMATAVLGHEDTVLTGKSVEVSVDAIHRDGNSYTWKVTGWSVPGDVRHVVLAARMVVAETIDESPV
jgi:PAS domain S-box-containing protein